MDTNKPGFPPSSFGYSHTYVNLNGCPCHYEQNLLYTNKPVYVLQHVEVWRDVLEEPGGLVGAQHLVHEVHVTEVVARPTLVLHLQNLLA